MANIDKTFPPCADINNPDAVPFFIDEASGAMAWDQDARRFRVDRSATAAAIADRAHSKGEWERAARFYLDALGSDPVVAELWLRLGDSLKAAGKSLEAEFAYRRAAALQPTPTQLKL